MGKSKAVNGENWRQMADGNGFVAIHLGSPYLLVSLYQSPYRAGLDDRGITESESWHVTTKGLGFEFCEQGDCGSTRELLLQNCDPRPEACVSSRFSMFERRSTASGKRLHAVVTVGASCYAPAHCWAQLLWLSAQLARLSICSSAFMALSSSNSWW